MIIRKPYAFLIKNFKIIHLFMLIMTSYLLYKTYNIYKFFNEYVLTRQVIYSETLSNDIIPVLVLLISILCVGAFTLIFILFRQKDKPKLLYILGMTYYALFIVFSIVSKSTITTILIDGLDPRVSRIMRDIWLILFIIQIGFVVILLIRTSGFDIKRFDFKEDIAELKISDEDNEEIEVSTRFDADKIRMKAAMQREELKAFYYENKLIILSILFIIVIILPGTLISKSIIDNKRYKENEILKMDDFNLKITNSYYTKKDYKNNVLLKGKNVYLIIKFNIENKTKEEIDLILDNLRLETNDKIYIPNTTYYEYFKDVGIGYTNQKIKEGSKDYIAVYLLNEEDITSKMIIRYTDKVSYSNNEINAVYKRIIITPKTIDEKVYEKQILLNQEYKFTDDTLKGTTINIQEYELKDYFTIPNSIKLIVNNTGYVLKLKYETNSNSFADLINSYGELSYTYSDRSYKQKINIITPKNYKESNIYFAVDEEMNSATEIKLKLIIRNTIYTWIFK